MNTKRIKINLVSRFFDTRNQGQGRIAEDLVKGLKKSYDLTTTSCRGKTTINYFFYNVFFRFFTKKNSDVYIACTSMESFFLPPKKSVAIIHDLIPLLHTLKCNTHYNTSAHNVIGAWAFFYLTLMKSSTFAKIVCISKETKDDYIEITKCNPDKVVVIDNWIQDKYRFQPKQKSDKIKVGTLSVVDSRKRSKELVEEFMKIHDDKLELHIGGSGSILEEVKQLAKDDKRIFFYGHVPENKMVDFYKNLDVFIFPSSHEGFGIPIIEAIAIGKPVITIKDSVIPEKVMRNTTQITWNELQNSIYFLKDLTPEYLRHKSDWAISEFNFTKQMKKYEKLVEEVAHENY